jgi:hypothetical protein
MSRFPPVSDAASAAVGSALNVPTFFDHSEVIHVSTGAEQRDGAKYKCAQKRGV